MNLFADFFKSFNVVFSIKNPGNLQKMFVKNGTLQKPLTELHIFDDNSYILFSQPVPKQLISLL